ncbi:uncharacterized protein J8A68_004594 [[Candida] subhashii]|uniref:Carnosine N-methyltransferase n=1 Tax=[Candida] subhashii TaxID=561895 RepID=A0A8J5QGX7_9ASCO|nr:uncharacterized protein J8A68_004594 [[Candida] subhashii]KAG7661899.1 hypothetical protein J8A68_004594 [[Candida] subhashii]
MFGRTDLFRNIANFIISLKATTTAPVRFNYPAFRGVNHKNFQQLSEFQKVEVLSAVSSLRNYYRASILQLDRRRKLFKLMTWRQQRLCEDVGYLNKLKSIQKSIQTNSEFTNAVADHVIDTYGISYKDFNLIDNNKNNNNSSVSSTNYRVLEALSHYVRDWESLENIGQELIPIYNYVLKHLNNIIPEEEKSTTCLIFPGSGLGRMAYEFAKLGYGAVHAVEFSGLMSTFAQFNFSPQKSSSYKIFPYVHNNSDFYTTKLQLRIMNISLPGEKPDNFHLHHDDFRYFEIPNPEKYSQVVVISIYFLDTAENLMEYLDTIKKLTGPKLNNSIKRGYWINAGPLKYGTAAQVELNADELTLMRKKTGWLDLDSVYTLKDPSSVGNDTGLVGYVTDTQSMWQGYYGLNMFATAREENK